MSISTLTHHDVVRWLQPLPVGALGFELRSDDAHLMQHAERIFQPFLAEAASCPDAPLRRFRIEPRAPVADSASDQAGDWEVRCDDAATFYNFEDPLQPGPQCLIRSTLARALATVEFDAVYSTAQFSQVSARRGVVGLHGALLEKDGRGVLIVGHKEAGKSTLSCALWQRGWSLLSDDYALIESRAGSSSSPASLPRAFPTVRRVSLRVSSRHLLGAALWQRALDLPASDFFCTVEGERLLFHPHELDGRPPHHSTPLCALVLLERPGSLAGAGQMRALAASQALFTVLPHCGISRREDFGPALQTFGPLFGAVPAFDLRRGPLAAMAENLERVLLTL